MNSRISVCISAFVCVTDIAYWTRSLSARDRLQRLTSAHPHPNLAGDEVILDEQTRRLLDDSHLLIATQRLVLLDIIGQGPFIVSCKAITRIFFFGGGELGFLQLLLSFSIHFPFSFNQSIDLRLLAAWQNAGQKYTEVIHIAIVQDRVMCLIFVFIKHSCNEVGVWQAWSVWWQLPSEFLSFPRFEMAPKI